MNMHATIPATIDLAMVKARQQGAWSSGTLVVPSEYLEIVLTRQ